MTPNSGEENKKMKKKKKAKYLKGENADSNTAA